MSVQRTGWMVAAMLGGLITTAQAQPPGSTPSETAAPDDSSISAKDPLWRDRRWSFVTRLGYEHGGDDLLKIKESDGTSFDLTAGSGVLLAAGVLFTPHPLFALELTAGYKVSADGLTDALVSLHRIPLEAIASFTPGNHRIGIGPTLHAGTRLDCHIGSCDGHIDVDPALGVVVQWVYTAKNIELGARATLIHYRPADKRIPDDATVSGSNVGGFIGVRL